MKKLYFIVFLFISLYSLAQSWCKPGATWHYKDNYQILSGYKVGVTEHKFTGTVTVNSIVCSEIARTFTGVVSHPTNAVTVFTIQPIQTYSNNGVYYIYNTNSNAFDTLCNFNAAVGNKWQKPWDGNCVDRVTVVDTGHIFVNSVPLKMIVLSGSWGGNDTVVERIAGFNHFLTTYAICITDYPPWGDLICYQDNSFLLYKKKQSMNCFYDVSLNEFEKLNSIYPSPNPFNDQLIIHSQRRDFIIDRLEIINTLGQKVFFSKQQKVNEPIEVDLPKGIYMINLEMNEKVTSYKIIRN